jgi:phosphopantothenoylcysteine decarboxylase/phosphopantothenate--cysteine ligase
MTALDKVASMPAKHDNPEILKDRQVVLGVTGGIAAYKTAMLASRLVQAGAVTTVVMTEHATRFVGPLTFQTLTGRLVYVEQFASPELYRVEHISLADRAEIMIVAPATANCLAKLAHGIADDLLSTVLLAVTAPLLLAPAMNEKMWAHPATQANLAVLKSRGVHLIGPDEGRLACGTSGPGRMAEPDAIFEEIVRLLGR